MAAPPVGVKVTVHVEVDGEPVKGSPFVLRQEVSQLTSVDLQDLGNIFFATQFSDAVLALRAYGGAVALKGTETTQTPALLDKGGFVVVVGADSTASTTPTVADPLTPTGPPSTPYRILYGA